MNQNLEELKELLMYSYRKLGYTVTTDKDMLYLRFSPDSQSPAVMVRCANESRPLDRAAVQQMFMEFERMGAQNGCHQYPLGSSHRGTACGQPDGESVGHNGNQRALSCRKRETGHGYGDV